MTDLAQKKLKLNVNAESFEPYKPKARPKKVSKVSSNGYINAYDKLTASLTEPSSWKSTNAKAPKYPSRSKSIDDKMYDEDFDRDVDQIICAIKSEAFQESLPQPMPGYLTNSPNSPPMFTQYPYSPQNYHYTAYNNAYYNVNAHQTNAFSHYTQPNASMSLPKKKKWPRIKTFEPKTGSNHSKGNFYISEEMIIEMLKKCAEKFDSFRENDEGLAFSYFKQSVAMSINDGQIRIIESKNGEVIIIDIDLHFKDGQKMYFVAIENEKDHIQQMKWRIIYIKTKQELFESYPDVTDHLLPTSSRNVPSFLSELRFDPFNVSLYLDKYNPQKQCHIIKQTKSFHKLPKKYPKDKGKTEKIKNNDFLRWCDKTFKSGNYKVIPVVIIKGKRTWIEWKIPIKVMNDEYVCVSLKYNSSNAQWVFSCLDFDAGCLYYKHRLVGLAPNDPKNFSYNEVKKYCTISLEFV